MTLFRMAVPASSDSASGPWALALTSALDWAKDTPAPAQGPPEAPTSPTSKVCRKRRREEPVGHYDVLGITRTASNVEIRVAYRKGALQTHPDAWPGVDRGNLSWNVCRGENSRNFVHSI